MGRYSLRALFDKEPAVIAGVVRSVLFALVLAGLLVIDEKVLAASALALELVLTLFVRGSTTPTASPTLAAGTTVTVTTPDTEPNTTVEL